MTPKRLILKDTSPAFPGQTVYVLQVESGEEYDLCVSPRQWGQDPADTEWIRSKVDVAEGVISSRTRKQRLRDARVALPVPPLFPEFAMLDTETA